jgi:putative flippase GtrA
MAKPDATDTKTTPKGIRHWLGFGASGAIAFVTDVTMLKLIVYLTPLPVNAARLISIAIAMVAGWLAHRRLTFNVQTAPSVQEFLRYAGVAWFAAAINYAVFVTILWFRPSLEPIIAAALSAGVAMVVAYLGMKFAAFRPRSTGP